MKRPMRLELVVDAAAGPPPRRAAAPPEPALVEIVKMLARQIGDELERLEDRQRSDR